MGAGLDSCLPQLPLGPGVGGAARVPGAHSRRPARDWRERRGRGALRGRGRRAARSSRPVASMGRRQRPPAPAPRKHSPRRAAPRPLAGSGTLQSCGIAVAPPPRGRARMRAGGGQGARGAGRPGESHGPGKAAGCAQKPDWPRRGGLGPRPEPARWAGHGAWTPPLTPVRPRGETWRFGKGELV